MLPPNAGHGDRGAWLRALAAQCARAFARTTLERTEAQGKPGARCTRSLACESDKAPGRSHHRFTGNTQPSLRNGFNGLFRALPGDRAFLPPSFADSTRDLDASVGASGPHDFAVRVSIARLATPTRPSHPAPNVRGDCAYAPLSGAGRRELVAVICPTAQAEYFFAKGWTGFRARRLICPSGKSITFVGWAKGALAPCPPSSSCRSLWARYALPTLRRLAGRLAAAINRKITRAGKNRARLQAIESSDRMAEMG